MGRIALYLGRDYPFGHTKTNFILKWTIYGPVRNIGIDPKGMREYTPIYLTNGRGWPSNHPPMLCILVKIFWLNLKTILAQINRFWPKNGWFSILAKFNQNFYQNAKFGSVRPIELLLLLLFFFLTPHHLLEFYTQKYSPNCTILVSKKYKIFQLLRGATSPLKHPSEHDIKSSPHVKDWSTPLVKMHL